MIRTKEQKADVVTGLVTKLRRAPTVYVTDFTGLNVAHMTDLRLKLRAAGVEYVVVKNTLARRALLEAQVSGLEPHLTGATALVLGGADPMAAAKVLTDFAKEHQKPAIKGALVEGRMVTSDQVKQLAALRAKSKRLEAERDLKEKLEIPDDIVPTKRAVDFDDVITEQQVEFSARYARYVAEREILTQRIAALQEALPALDGQKKAMSDQLATVRDEIDRKLLLRQPLTARIHRAAARRGGAISSRVAAIADRQLVDADYRNKQQIERLTTSRVEDLWPSSTPNAPRSPTWRNRRERRSRCSTAR